MAGYMSSKKTMEINPENYIMEEPRKRVDADKNDKSLKDLVHSLFETALSLRGSVLMSPILSQPDSQGCLSWVRALTRTNGRC
ncbi:hypothetical protein IFM89_002832 [Coptis chinensis]|uniref:Uncharacterized protein n=1 Tax=Coptis chinensis TaxID=261450 RepID=A0A835I0M5_9MAGN|nr:hypothetical protein IFM89_002832 [Coptis chinensis]